MPRFKNKFTIKLIIGYFKTSVNQDDSPPFSSPPRLQRSFFRPRPPFSFISPSILPFIQPVAAKGIYPS